MTLEQLLGELQTLALAYPDETPIRFGLRDQRGEVVGVIVESAESGVAVVIEGQA